VTSGHHHGWRWEPCHGSSWRLLEGPTRHLAGWAALLGLVTGFIIANGNPGNLLIYGVLIAALAAVRWRAIRQRWGYVAAAGAIALLIAAPNAVLLATERAMFPDPIRHGSEPLPLASLWDVFLRPLGQSGLPWQEEVFERGARLPFFGGPFALLCIVALTRRGWQRPELAIAVLLALLPLYVALIPAFGVSDRWLYRDVVVLFGIPLAGMAAERGLRRQGTRGATAALLVAQAAVVVLAALPFLSDAWEEGDDGAPTFHGAVGDMATCRPSIA
jgi:hypothetical protein